MKAIIYYQRKFGSVFEPTMIDVRDLKVTHVPVAVVDYDENNERGLGDIYVQMQGEVWSPNGEARSLIEALGLGHTSMSVGDLIVIPELREIHYVDFIGFKRIW